MKYNDELKKCVLGMKVLVLARAAMALDDPDWGLVTEAIAEAEQQVRDLYEDYLASTSSGD